MTIYVDPAAHDRQPDDEPPRPYGQPSYGSEPYGVPINPVPVPVPVPVVPGPKPPGPGPGPRPAGRAQVGPPPSSPPPSSPPRRNGSGGSGGRRPGGRPAKKATSPLWTRICVVLGSIVMVLSVAGVVVPRLVAAWATSNIPKANLIPDALQGNDISGAINFLLLGMDERTGNKDLIRADSIIIVHISADHKSAYMVSLPRDAQVTIPAYPPTGYQGGVDKINAAFAFGSMTPQEQGDDSTAGRERGAALTIETINNVVPGGLKFNGAAIISFDGFRDILKAIDGVDLCVDVETRSIHYDYKGIQHTNEVPYDLQKVYKVGCQHMDPTSALDYSRQRHYFDTGDYVRQRHQQQLLMAIFHKMFSAGTLTDPSKVAAIQGAAGQLLTLDPGRNSILDWLFTLKGLDPKHVVMIKTNGGQLYPGSISGNEAFSPDSMDMLKAVHDDNLIDFLGRHPDWITADNTPKQT
jgi:LCP family protein required for cell wall assembly